MMPDDSDLRSVLTSWGVIKLEIDAAGVAVCTLPRLDGIPMESFAILEAGSDPYSSYIRKLFEGKNPQPPPIGRLQGTPFQIDVWRGLQNIRKGETRSYAELAAAIGHARSARAVANACGRNPAPLFIPCHRVIRSDGGIGGFSSGTAWKKLLLAVECPEC